jgi:hypothetical protein
MANPALEVARRAVAAAAASSAVAFVAANINTDNNIDTDADAFVFAAEPAVVLERVRTAVDVGLRRPHTVWKGFLVSM